MRHKWVRRGQTIRTCEACGMSVDRKPDRRYAWSLRPGKAVLVDGKHTSAGQAPTLKSLPGCFTDQLTVPVEQQVQPSYGVFVRITGEKSVLRMTPAGNTTAGDLHAAVFANEDCAQRHADDLRTWLDAQHPGSEVWTAPL